MNVIYFFNNNRKNSINRIKINGEGCNDPCKIKLETLSFFKTKFNETWPSRPKLISPIFKKLLDSELHHNLQAPISLDEITASVWACGNEKAQGPTGFPSNS